MPDKKEKNRLLSPTVLSFQNDGFFSVPDILDVGHLAIFVMRVEKCHIVSMLIRSVKGECG